jgi:hypothetical protein
MGTFTHWIKTTYEKLVDTGKDEEVAKLVRLLHEGIAEKKQSFVLSAALAGRAYKNRDGRMTTGEKSTLEWAAKCLELDEATVRDVNLRAAREMFAVALAKAIDDGEITKEESATLDEIARVVDLSLRDFVKRFFQDEGEAFIRGGFATALENGRSSTAALDQLSATAVGLGLTRDEVLQMIQPQVIQHIEHLLADAKEDDVLTPTEDVFLCNLLETFTLPPEKTQYFREELKDLRQLTEIKNGRLPCLPAPAGISVRAGELIHYHGLAIWECQRLLKSGPTVDRHSGYLTITDSRVIFTSPTKADAFSYSKVVAYDCSWGDIVLQVQGKSSQSFTCRHRPKQASLVFEAALKMANQVLVNTDETRRSRHISREVRQRVWQRFGGRCAECAATDYLEFDHIVPVAKGGSNSDQNVQLLCRRCNLKKSDRI